MHRRATRWIPPCVGSVVVVALCLCAPSSGAVPLRTTSSQGDDLLLLRSAGENSELVRIAVDRDGKPRAGPRTCIQQPVYPGIALLSRSACLLLSADTAYRWPLGTDGLVPIGDLPERPGPQSVYADSFSSRSGMAVVYHDITEGYAYPTLWKPGSSCWQEIRSTYPRLGRLLHPRPGTIIASAAYSPDGSLLAVAAPGATQGNRLLVYDIDTAALVASLDMGTAYVWSLAISPGNDEVCWLEVARDDERQGADEREGGAACQSTGPMWFRNQALGVAALGNGCMKRWTLAEMLEGEALDVGFHSQGAAKIGFSGDGEQLFFLADGRLFRFDRETCAAVALADRVASFTVLPAGALP